MSYKITWVVPNSVIEVILPDILDNTALMKFDEDITAMLDTATQPVYAVFDVGNIHHYPSVNVYLKLKYYAHPNRGPIVAVGMSSNPTIRFLIGVITRAVGFQVKEVATLEEAHAYIASLETID